jgi:SAM-dependent methyltransferase
MFSRNIEQKYGNSQKYSNPNPIQQRLISRFLDTVARLVKQTESMTLVDIGCSEGFVLRHLQGLWPGLRCYGIDIDFDALERGRFANRGVQVQKASIYNIPFKARAFDLALCLEVLEHLDEPEKALKELIRITRRYCLLSVPHEPLFRMANFLRGKSMRRFGNDIDHLNHWGKNSFTRLLQEAGLIIRNVEMSFPWLVVLAEVDYGLLQ